MEYPEGRSTTMRRVARKVGLYDLKVVSLWGRYFWTGGPAYDNIPPLGLQRLSPIRFIRESHDGT